MVLFELVLCTWQLRGRLPDASGANGERVHGALTRLQRAGRWRKGSTKVLEAGGGARQAPYISDAREGRHLRQAKQRRGTALEPQAATETPAGLPSPGRSEPDTITAQRSPANRRGAPSVGGGPPKIRPIGVRTESHSIGGGRGGGVAAQRPPLGDGVGLGREPVGRQHARSAGVGGCWLGQAGLARSGPGGVPGSR